MTSDPTTMQEYSDVLQTVREWSVQQRFMLVQDVLQTLAPQSSAVSSRQPTLADALGLLATTAPTPSDEDIAAVIDQRRLGRYGS